MYSKMSIQFQIDADPMYSWNAWGNMSYRSVADVVAELIDNSKQAGAKNVAINIFKEGDQRYITIEDNGQWGDINRELLVKCFGYGKGPSIKKEGLNEHNCGLKHSFAYMDPENKSWSIQIKKNGVTWQLAAPYSHAMTMNMIDHYNGSFPSDNATLIKIPMGNTQFKTLYYTRSVKSEPNDEMLTERLGTYLSCFWMMCDDFMKKKFQITLNGKLVEPYDILRDPSVTFGGEKGKVPKRKMCLTPPGSPEIEVDVEVWHLSLTSQYRKDHPLFKRNADQSGVFIFKHGRYIKGPIFPEIYGKSRDYHFSHHVVLVNIAGVPEGLPATHTTKNDFNNKDPKLETLYSYINSVAPAIQDTKKDNEILKCELEYIRRLAQQKRQNYKRQIDRDEYKVYEQEEFELYHDSQRLVNKDKPDMVEHDKRDNIVTITEGKKDRITPEGLRQLFFYYRNLKYCCPTFKDCEFEVKFITLDDRITKAYEDELVMLQRLDPAFNPVIETFAQYNIS